MIISLIQDFEADFLWKVSLKILNSGIILKTFTHAAIAPDRDWKQLGIYTPFWLNWVFQI